MQLQVWLWGHSKFLPVNYTGRQFKSLGEVRTAMNKEREHHQLGPVPRLILAKIGGSRTLPPTADDIGQSRDGG